MLTATDRHTAPTLGITNPNKAELLVFMKSGEEYAMAEGYVKDLMTGEYVKTQLDSDFSRDGLLWSASELYNFEKYDLALNPDFCKAALEPHEA